MVDWTLLRGGVLMSSGAWWAIVVAFAVSFLGVALLDQEMFQRRTDLHAAGLRWMTGFVDMTLLSAVVLGLAFLPPAMMAWAAYSSPAKASIGDVVGPLVFVALGTVRHVGGWFGVRWGLRVRGDSGER
jgi:hypothetical protein